MAEMKELGRVGMNRWGGHFREEFLTELQGRRGIQAYRESCDGALVIITHNARLLNRLHVDVTHVMVRGTIVASGDGSLVGQIDREGFAAYEQVAQIQEAMDEAELGGGEA